MLCTTLPTQRLLGLQLAELRGCMGPTEQLVVSTGQTDFLQSYFTTVRQIASRIDTVLPFHAA